MWVSVGVGVWVCVCVGVCVVCLYNTEMFTDKILSFPDFFYLDAHFYSWLIS